MPVGKWLNGLIGGFIGGGAGAVTSTVTASMLAPEQFNAGAQWKSLLSLMAVTFAVNGAFGAFLYLKQHPVPEWDGTTGANE
jgi:hypothetical protein